MNRISREQMFMDICDVIAKRSTCGRNNVAALLVDKWNNIVSMGYNGPPSGEPHCLGAACNKTPSGGCNRSIHAEENAISRGPTIGRIGEYTLYTSLSPCVQCAVAIIKFAKIKKVYYRQEYRDRTSILVLSKEGIEVYRLTPAGHLINAVTNELIGTPEA